MCTAIVKRCHWHMTGTAASGPPASRVAQSAGSSDTSSPISRVQSEPNSRSAADASWPHIQQSGAPPARSGASSESGKTVTCACSGMSRSMPHAGLREAPGAAGLAATAAAFQAQQLHGGRPVATRAHLQAWEAALQGCLLCRQCVIFIHSNAQ